MWCSKGGRGICNVCEQTGGFLLEHRYASIKFTSRWRSTERLEILKRCTKIRLSNRSITSVELDELCEGFDLETLDLSFNRIDYLDLKPLGQCKNLKRLVLTCNYIEKIDLRPLRSCKQLELLDLSENLLSQINLNYLQSFPKLEYLGLQGNRIQNMDFVPLIKCQNLKYLNVSRNVLKSINIAPLLLCRNLETLDIDDFTRSKMKGQSEKTPVPIVLIDAAVRVALSEGRPEWVQNVNYRDLINSDQYGELVRKLGWKSTREHLMKAMKHVDEQDMINAQRELFGALNMDELACYEGSLFDILMLLPEDTDYKEGHEVFYEAVLKLLKKQLEDNGNTSLFDIEKLTDTRGVVLIPLVLEKRAQEMEDVVIEVEKDQVDLTPLKNTYYGKEILNALGLKERVETKSLWRIQEAVECAGFTLRISS